jgi:methionyl-tRNA formyltransferase
VRIACLGLPLAAILLHHDGHEIVWAGICRRDALGLRRLRRIVGKDDVVLLPDLDKSVDRVRELRPDLVVSWFWTKKVPRSFREIAPHGAVGVHPSLLPRHRGPDPYFWAIDSGDAVTGVTAHVLDDEYDTGAIIGQQSLAIDPSWNSWTLAKKLDRPSLALLRATVTAFASGTPPISTPQHDAAATPAPEPNDELLEIRWSDPAERIARRIRAASPWPGAFTAIDDTTVTLTRVAVTDDFPRALERGEAAVRKDGIAVVRAADAALELHRGRSEEDERDLDAKALAELVRERSTTE